MSKATTSTAMKPTSTTTAPKAAAKPSAPKGPVKVADDGKGVKAPDVPMVASDLDVPLKRKVEVEGGEKKRGKREVTLVNLGELDYGKHIYLGEVGKFKNTDGKRCMIYSNPTEFKSVLVRVDNVEFDSKFGYSENEQGARTSYSVRLVIPGEYEDVMAAFDDALAADVFNKAIIDADDIGQAKKNTRSFTQQGKLKDKKDKNGPRWPRRLGAKLTEKNGVFDAVIRDEDGNDVVPCAGTLNGAHLVSGVFEIRFLYIQGDDRCGVSASLRSAVIGPAAGAASNDELADILARG